MRSVRLQSNGTTGFGSTLADSVTGAELRGVGRIVATLCPDDYTIIKAEFIAAEVEIEGRLLPMVSDPATGEMREVSRIVFADGSEWTA